VNILRLCRWLALPLNQLVQVGSPATPEAFRYKADLHKSVRVTASRVLKLRIKGHTRLA